VTSLLRRDVVNSSRVEADLFWTLNGCPVVVKHSEQALSIVAAIRVVAYGDIETQLEIN
jgi:hypothetical protein